MADKAALRQSIKERPASKILDAERFHTYLQEEDSRKALERLAGEPTLYDSDFYAWTQAQAMALQGGDWPALDLEHLREEIADLGSNLDHELESRLVNLLLHLLKWHYQPERCRQELAQLPHGRPATHRQATPAQSQPQAAAVRLPA